MKVLTSGGGVLGGLLLLGLGILMLIGLFDFLLRVGGVVLILVAVFVLFRAFTGRKKSVV